ncbi:hypothetical protein [Massilia sp. AB1]|uniref:AbiTii domain-containing protein n=1 Tax=Massilia sp. AB1 TaxID=2823371 RepID=UPI001B825C1A|nr:hypothetical protein [Massilia sp. AB1]MBQ5939862.1 hypothetical protein [Massilia sp. AB1]
MKLLNDIVGLLMNEAGSLNEALLKTKVLLHQIGHRELVGWVTSELSGYPDDAELPPYRKVHFQVYGTITNGYHIYPRRILSARHLRKQFGDVFEVAQIAQAIGVLEKNVSESTAESAMTKQFGPQVDKLLSEPYAGGYYVEGSYSYIGIGQIQQILIEVRSRLLDFILELQSEVGMSVQEEDIKKMTISLDVPGMFGKAVFGDNTTILLGNHNNQQVTNTSLKNDKAALADELRRNKVAEADIVALDVALSEDPVPTGPGQYGPAAEGWMKRMLGKAIDGSWNVSIGTAGSLLATAIQKYYGF